MFTPTFYVTTVFIDTRLWKTKHSRKRFHKERTIRKVMVVGVGKKPKKIHAEGKSNCDFYLIYLKKLASVYKSSSISFRKFLEPYPRSIIINK